MQHTTRHASYVQYGCGLCAPEGWLNFDASPILRWQRMPLLGPWGTKFGPRFPSNARFGDIVRGLPVAAASCQAIYCSHVLEHLALDDMRVALRNTWRYLAPGGVFRCVVPDLEQLTRDYLACADDQSAMRFMHESGLGFMNRPRGWRGLLREWLGNSRHRWLWDYRSLERELKDAGFVDVRRASFGDAVDPMFREVEDCQRWEGCLGIESRRP